MDVLKPLHNSKISLFKTFFILLTLSFQNGIAQIGIGLPAGQDPQATLDVGFDETVAPGFLMPRVNNLPEATNESPITEGMLVYYSGDDSSLVNSYYVYIDGEWKTLAETAGIILPGVGGGGNGVVTIHEGYFENGNDGWLDFNDSNRVQSGYSCEQNYSMQIWNSNGESKIELRDQDLSSYNAVSIEFEYRTNSNWESEDYFSLKFNNQELGRWYSSDQNFSSVTLFIDSGNYSFGSADDFKFQGEMSWDGESVFIDAVVIKGYTQPTATVCETSFEDDFGCWEPDNNSTVWRGNWYPNTGQGHLYFQSDDLNNSSNFDNSYISTAAPIDASEFSAGMIQMWYSGNGNTEDENDNGTDYLRLQYYNGSGWSNFPEGSYGVQPWSYEFLSYSIPADYLTNNLRIRIKFDATRPDERLFVDDTAIIFY